MADTKFTPGPWNYEPMDTPRPLERQHAIRIYAEDPGPSKDFHIGLVVDIDKETRESNARLIAAAPLMYGYINKEALKGDAKAQAIIDSICRSS